VLELEDGLSGGLGQLRYLVAALDGQHIVEGEAVLVIVFQRLLFVLELAFVDIAVVNGLGFDDELHMAFLIVVLPLVGVHHKVGNVVLAVFA
jgi:hypothetical protein